jgi:hypothetical protein
MNRVAAGNRLDDSSDPEGDLLPLIPKNKNKGARIVAKLVRLTQLLAAQLPTNLVE